jgi:uncharacterized protein DUF1553/uncharacterized protein DUF1549/cytochrome c
MCRSIVGLGLAGLVLFAIDAGAAQAGRKIDYARDVRPILSSRCFQCHGPDEQARKGDLRLDDFQAATRELPSGSRAIVPQNSPASALVERITSSDDDAAMPPRTAGKPLTESEITILRTWIDQGATYTKHWAYIRPARHPVPSVSDAAWPANPIDYFILARLEAEGLRPAAVADRGVLGRRVALDLTGLPPTLEEVDRFVNDPNADAYDRLVDRLLARPAYGEHWAAVWLDLARYGDSQGYIHDPPRTIWRWRDWLIGALNDNLPYDQLTIEMLAGDLLPGAVPSQIIATGFHRNTTNNTEGGANTEEYRHASVVDRVNTTMQTWMGTTFGCAQCHNHKYDPFTQKEYYQLFAVFNNTEDTNSETPILETAHLGMEAECAARRARLAAARQRLSDETARVDAERTSWEATVDRATLPKEIVDILALAVDQRAKAQIDKLAAHHRSLSGNWSARNAEAAQLQAELELVSTTTLVMKEGPVRPTHVAIRGEYKNLGEAVEPAVPAALHPAHTGARLDRLGLARWIVDRDNPLAARVAVNRLWQEIFGAGIVETSEEFGNQGEPPSHPEALDWLATEYMRLDWDTKKLLKLIVTSATYRQSSQTSEALTERDPFNRLLARGPRIRSSAEVVRDQVLAAAGLLSTKMHGPAVHPPQPLNGLAAAFGPSTDWETSGGEDRYRRAIYTRWRRNLPYASMATFDAPERSVCSMRRTRTNTPLQSLTTLNDPVFVEAAQALARRILSEGGPSVESRSAFAFRQVLLRDPAATESERLVLLFAQAGNSLKDDAASARALASKPLGPVPPGVDPVDAAAWTVVGNVLLNLDEVLAKP